MKIINPIIVRSENSPQDQSSKERYACLSKKRLEKRQSSLSRVKGVASSQGAREGGCLGDRLGLGDCRREDRARTGRGEAARGLQGVAAGGRRAVRDERGFGGCGREVLGEEGEVLLRGFREREARQIWEVAAVWV